MDIDLVYTWVNSSDPIWNAKKHQYAASEVKADQHYSDGDARYKDNGELAYSVQSVQRHLPFVRHIYIAYAGSPPNWLGSGSSWLRYRDRISLIRQDDLLPSGIAPTFNSHVIECFLHKIPGLSEHYLYSNDDFFFSKRHTANDFFTPSGCCRVGVCDRFAGFEVKGDVKGPFEESERKSARALRQRLELPAHIPVGRACLSKALNHPRLRLRALWRGMPLLNVPTHVTQPYRKSYWDGFLQTFHEEITDLCRRRFRSRHEFAVNMMYHHYLRSIGACHFYYEPQHAYLDRSQPVEDRDRLQDALLAERPDISRFCLNDNHAPDNDGWPTFIHSLMDRLGYHVMTGEEGCGEFTRALSSSR